MMVKEVRGNAMPFHSNAVVAVLGIILLIFVVGVFLPNQTLITGKASATIMCNQACTSPMVYKQWNAINQQGCISNCCVSQCASTAAYKQFGAANQQDCVKKCSALPALTSQGMISTRRIKQVSTLL